MRGRNTMISSAPAGLGVAIAQTLARLDANVVLINLSADQLATTAASFAEAGYEVL
jgi:NAD(P)-dependent dehydrogenase (short-subunit alcohol dehydrogenase family)